MDKTIRYSRLLKKGYFGPYGGRYVPEMLIPALEELESAYKYYKKKSDFKRELKDLFHYYSGRPTPLYFAKNLTKKVGGAKIFLKMEGANHTGAHKINNALGQVLLTVKMGKKKIIAETGAGQHGLAAATVAAKFGLNCKVFMGSVDMRRQYPNVYAMRLLGTTVEEVTDGTKTLKDAVNAAMKYWIENLKDTHYLLGSALGPHPYPQMVRDFQSIIGKEVKEQFFKAHKKMPDCLIACVGGGSNSMGLFYPFLDDGVELIGVEAGGTGNKLGENASRMAKIKGKKTGSVGIVQGYKSYFLQNSDGQLAHTHSISAGLDYAGIGPELAALADLNRVQFISILDEEAIKAFSLLAETEGIFPAMETSHAIAYAVKKAKKMKKNQSIVVNVSGRGDKDIFITAPKMDKTNWKQFLKEEIKSLA